MSQAVERNVSGDPNSYRYPASWRYGTAEEQLRRLVETDASLRTLDASYVQKVRENFAAVPTTPMEAFLVQPKLRALAGLSDAPHEWPAFNRALHYIMRVLALRMDGFLDCTTNVISPDRHRLAPRTLVAYEQMKSEYPGDYLVFPIQTGARYRGRSVDEVRNSLGANEFGLDALSTACFLVGHPSRLNGFLSLGIDCPGSECRSEPTTQYSLAPYWGCFDAERGIAFDIYATDIALPSTGSATGTQR